MTIGLNLVNFLVTSMATFFWLFNFTYRGFPITSFWIIAIIATSLLILMNLIKFRKMSLILGVFIGALAYIGLIFLIALSALP